MAINFKEITIATNDATNKCILGVWFEDGPPTVYPFVSIPSEGDDFRYGTPVTVDLGEGPVIGHCIGPYADVFRRRSTPTMEWVDRVAIDDPANWVITGSGRTVTAVYQGESVPIEARSVLYGSTTTFSCHMEHIRYLQLDDVLAEGSYTVTNTVSGYSRPFVYSDRTTRCCGLRVDQGWMRPDDPYKHARLANLIYGAPNAGVIDYSAHTTFEIINAAGTTCFSGNIGAVINETDQEVGVVNTYCYADVAPSGKKTATAWDEHSRKITSAAHGFVNGQIVITHGFSNGTAAPNQNIGSLWNCYIRVAGATTDDFRIGSGSFRGFGGVATALLDSITFSTDLITSNSISGTVNGNAWGPVVFTTSHANTMSLICTAIQGALANTVAEVSTEIASGGGGSMYHPAGRTIEVRITTSTNLTLTCAVTLGASQPTVTLNHPTFTSWVAGSFDAKHDSKIYPANVRNRWGTKVYKIDYSETTAANFPDSPYRVRIPGLGVSFPTIIDMAGHHEMLRAIATGRLGQLGGIELDGTHSIGGLVGVRRGLNFVDGLNDQKVFWSAMPGPCFGLEHLITTGAGIDSYQAGVGRHLVYTGNFVTGNVINGKIGGVSFGPINFSVNSTNTFNLVLDAVIAAAATVSPNYFVYADSRRGQQAIWVTSRPRTDFAFPPPFTELTVTGGASQPVVSAPTPWYTEVRATGFRASIRDAGDHDFIGHAHSLAICMEGIWGYDSLPSNARAFDFGFPKIHEVYTGSIYNSGNWLSSILDLILIHLEGQRVTQRADGGVYSGTAYNSSENSGLGASFPAFETSEFNHCMLTVHAAEPTTTMMYACMALQMSKRFRAAGHTAAADAWYESGILAYDWAESMYQSWLGDDSVIDAYFIGELAITSRDECPPYTTIKSDLFGTELEWDAVRKAASAVRYSIDGGSTYEVRARGLGASNDSWQAVTLWEYVHATGQTPARDATTLATYQGLLAARDGEATTYLGSTLAYPSLGATGAISNDKWSTLHSYVYGGHEDVLKMLLGLKMVKCGVNGLNKAYITGVGTHYIKDPLFGDTSVPLLPPGNPPPGISVYGITTGDILGNNGQGCNTLDGPLNAFASVSTGLYDASDGFRKVIEPLRPARPLGAQSLNCSLNIFEREFSFTQTMSPLIGIAANLHARDGNTKTTLGPNRYIMREV